MIEPIAYEVIVTTRPPFRLTILVTCPCSSPDRILELADVGARGFWSNRRSRLLGAPTRFAPTRRIA